jgi:hypothetical protein
MIKMAHMEKYTKAACGHLFEHYARGKNSDNTGYVKYKNQDIDPVRTSLNYNLAPNQNQMSFLHQRLSEVYCLKRKDVNVMCSWIVTLPKGMKDGPPAVEREFFKHTYDFLSDHYGKENVISAYVHKDEVTPHLHFSFLPVVPDQRRGGEKISAKEAVNLRDLQRFHGDLDRYLSQSMGAAYPGGILTGIVKEQQKNFSIQELKQRSAELIFDEIAAARAESSQIVLDAKETARIEAEKVEKTKKKERASARRIRNLKQEEQDLSVTLNLASQSLEKILNDVQSIAKEKEALESEIERIRGTDDEKIAVEIDQARTAASLGHKTIQWLLNLIKIHNPSLHEVLMKTWEATAPTATRKGTDPIARQAALTKDEDEDEDEWAL